MKRLEIIKEAKTWLGVPWEHQGRSRTGVDCAGYIINVGLNTGADTRGLNMHPTYSRDPDKTMELLLNKHLRRNDYHFRAMGLILFFGFNIRGQHIGFLSDKLDTFYHALESENKVVETRLDYRWQRRLRAVYDFFEVED